MLLSFVVKLIEEETGFEPANSDMRRANHFGHMAATPSILPDITHPSLSYISLFFPGRYGSYDVQSTIKDISIGI